MAVRSKFKSNEIVKAVDGFVTSALPGGPFAVAYGGRFRADHPVVKTCPDFFISDDAGEDETQPHGRPLCPGPGAQIRGRRPQAAPPKPLSDAEVVLDKVDGERVAKKSARAKENPSAFVEVNPAGLARKDALLALAYMSLH